MMRDSNNKKIRRETPAGTIPFPSAVDSLPKKRDDMTVSNNNKINVILNSS